MERCRDTTICAIFLTGCALTLPITQALAQQVRSARVVQQRPYIAPPRQPFKSMARETTPLYYEQYRSHPYPGMQRYCWRLENRKLRKESLRLGRPVLDESIIEVPALGCEVACVLGYACIGGQAFNKLPNGWEQLSADKVDGSDVEAVNLDNYNNPATADKIIAVNIMDYLLE